MATLAGPVSVAQDDRGYWAPVEQAMGKKGEVSPDGVVTFVIPRDLSVTLDGIRLAPGSDMSHEFSFMRTSEGTMMVGEIMLKEDEVAGVTQKLLAAGITETALHNHLLRERPHIMWLHVHANGDPVPVAKALNNIITPLDGGPATVSQHVPLSQLDTARLDAIIGLQGKAEDGVYAYSVPRADKINMGGVELPPDMDISTRISFQPTGQGKAAVIGEFVLEKSEVSPVLARLADNGVEVTALHSHMINEQPRLFYMHCWAVGDPAVIAGAMRKALDKTNSSV
ncbi:DUF1259 domain-containing protein [Methanocella paludicola]|nr:DUF1259 domain-containing protein [Methanocella paludicola]